MFLKKVRKAQNPYISFFSIHANASETLHILFPNQNMMKHFIKFIISSQKLTTSSLLTTTHSCALRPSKLITATGSMWAKSGLKAGYFEYTVGLDLK